MSGDNANAVLTVFAEQVITRLFDVIGREFGYLFSYKTNIKNLKIQVVQMENLKEDVVIFLNEQWWNNAERAKAIDGWLKEVEEVTLAAKAMEDKDKLRVWCVNLKNNRYWQSRKSIKLVVDIQNLLNKAPKIDAIHQTLPAAMLPGAAANDAAKDFISRTKIVDEVLDALNDEKINVIGICGLGGIGKTTILHEVRERARNQFDMIPMTTVSQVINMFEIQKNLADTLGLKSIQEVDDIIPRADLLHKRLTNGSKNLIILDDLWSEIKLNEVGIPVGKGMARCKVILASRYENVCTIMRTQKTIPVGVLSKDEAWHMFKKAAGDCIERQKLEKIAKEIIDRCGGLPIALVTIAGALFNKKKSYWEDAHRLLRQSNATSIVGMKEAYLPIMVSYKLLATHELQEAQPLLLICCQHGEDEEIFVEQLARYCLALELFKGVDKLVEARNRTYKLIEDLKSYFLLQAVNVDEEGMYEKVKMHDVVRDVCMSIVSEVKEEKDRVYMHIMSKDSSGGHDLGTNNEVDYPKLKLLMVGDYYDGVVHNIEQMEELRVLEIGKRHRHLYLQPELQVLNKLRMLCIESQHSLSEDMVAAIGSLSSLEILSWRSEIHSFPRQIGQLINLKLLDMRSLNHEDLFPSGILPQLNKLEVLCMGNYGLLGTGVDGDIKNGESYGHITELESLPNLTTLQIKLGYPTVLLDLKCFRFENLETFLFTMRKKTFSIVSSSLIVGKTIKLIGLDGMKWVKEANIQLLIRSTLSLRLEDNNDWTDPLILQEFFSLETLELKECNQLEYIIPGGSMAKLRTLRLAEMSKMRRVWMGPIDPLCLVNLRQIFLNGCEAMETLFPHTVAKCLVQLQELTIYDCPKLEGIFSKGDLGTTCSSATEIRNEPLNDFTVHLPKLRILLLLFLSELKGFYSVNIDDGKVPQHLINPRVIMLPSLERLKCSGLDHIKQIVGGGVLELSKLAACNWLQNLQEVDVYDCDLLETLFDFEGLHFMGENAQLQALGGLESINLECLPKLEHLFWQIPQGILSFQNLETLEVNKCKSLGYLMSSSMAHMLVNLKSLHVEDCKSIKVVIKMDENFDVKKIMFRSLSSLRLFYLEHLVFFLSNDCQSVEFPSLKELLIDQCPEMKSLCCGQKLQEVNLDDDSDDENILASNVNIEDGKVIQPLINAQVIMLPSLERLECSGLHHIKQILGGGVLQLSKLVSCNWLQNLQEVRVDNCDSLETLFDFEGLQFMGENAQLFTLGGLKYITLGRLPKLEHLFWQIPQEILSFQNLETLHVKKCESLGFLMSSSMAHMLVNIESLVVEDCKSIKVVIKIDEVYDVKNILFPFLSDVRLSYLKNLASFCSDDRQSIAFPTLDLVFVDKCPEMKTFCCGDLTAEKLQGVTIGSGKTVWEGDLNKTVRHLSERVYEMSKDCEKGDDLDEFSTDEGTQMKASIPLSIVTSPNASLTPNVVSDNTQRIADSSSPDLTKAALPLLIEFVPVASTEQSVHSSNDSLVQPIANKALSDMSSSTRDDRGSGSSIPLEQGSPTKASIPPSIVTSPNASLTTNTVSDFNEIIARSASPDLRMEACTEQSVHSSNVSPVQPKSVKELSDMSLSNQDDNGTSSSIPLDWGTPMKASIPPSIVTSPSASLTSNAESDISEIIARSSSPDLRIEASTEQSVHSSNDSPVQPKAYKEFSDMSSSNQDESGSGSSIPLKRSMPKKASMTLSVVASPNASLTSDIASPPPVADNNEDFVHSSSSHDLIRVALSPVIEQSLHSSDSLVQPKADHKELIDMSFSILDDDWKKSMTLIEGVYVRAKLKTTFDEILAANPNFLSGLCLKTAKMKSEAIESAICSLQILRQHTALTISSEELAYIKDSLDDMETSGLDTSWLKRGYQRAILVMKEQKVVSAAEKLAMLEREETEDEAVFEMARVKLQASKARRVAFKAEYDALLQELESGKELFGRGFELETSLGDGLLD